MGHVTGQPGIVAGCAATCAAKRYVSVATFVANRSGANAAARSVVVPVMLSVTLGGLTGVPFVSVGTLPSSV